MQTGPSPALDALEPRLLLAAYDAAFSTYLGSSDGDQVRDVALDGAGNAYVVGGVAGSDFPTTAGAHDRTFNGGGMDVFVAKVSPAGTLLWATYLGGGNYDRAYAVEVDASGVYVAGRAGGGFPTTAGSLQPSFAGDANPNPAYGQQDGFVAKLSLDGASVLWSTYFGEGSRGFVRDIDVDSAGRVHLAFTESDAAVSHVTPGAYQTSRGGGKDGVVAKLAADGSRVLWASYVGGSGDDLMPPSLRVDGQGYVYVAGATSSTDLPTTANAFDRTYNGGGLDLLVAKFKPDGSGVVYLTYLGGGGDEMTETHQLEVDAAGNAYVATTTTSANFPTTAGGYDRTHNGNGGSGSGASSNYPGDVHLAKLAADGTQMLAGTFVGGSAGEGVEGIGLDAAGNVYVSGGTYSTNLPATADARQANHGGGGLDGFAAVLSGDLAQLVYLTYYGGGGGDVLRTLDVRPDGTFLAAGETNSSNLPLLNALDGTRSGPTDGMLVRFTPGSTAPPAAEVQVLRGTTTNVADGTTTPPLSFGSVQQGASAVDVTFTIKNTGGQTLTLGSVVLANNSGFSVVTQPASSVAPGGSTTFVLRMATATAGSKTADVSFTNNDANESPFNFKVAGTVTVATGISVSVGADATVTEGGTFSRTGSFTPGSVGSSWTATVDFGDGGGAQALTLNGDHTFNLSHAYADDGAYTVTVIVSDDQGGADTDTLVVTVNGAQPVAVVGGDAGGVQGQRRTIALSATDASSADAAAGFGYEIDWGDGSALQTLAQGALLAKHAFAAAGTYAVTVRAIDKDGLKGAATTWDMVVKQAELQVDPTSKSKTALVVGGTPGDDRIRLRSLSDGRVKVLMNGTSVGAFAPTGRVVVNGWNGNDTIAADAALGRSAMLFGDAGNDALVGTDANDALVGGAGKDTLRGGMGRDLVIGGKSADRMYGGEDDDVLVAGLTKYDAKHSSLGKLLKEWSRQDATYAQRMAHLRGTLAGGLNGAVVLGGSAAPDDSSADVLTGEAGMDGSWFNTGASVLDEWSDRVTGEKGYDVV